MHTATEILMRMAHEEKRISDMRSVMDGVVNSLFGRILESKVPLIRYGRKKRRYRRMFPGQIAAVRVSLDGVEAITADRFYRQN